MKKNILNIVMINLFLFCFTSLSGYSQHHNHDHKNPNHVHSQKHPDWQVLGSRKVNYGLDKDVIAVNVKSNEFTKLKVKVTGGALNMHKMVVTYGNGTKDNISLKYNFKKGAESRVIDLKGGSRSIKTITFWYDSKNLQNKKATIHVAGKH